MRTTRILVVTIAVVSTAAGLAQADSPALPPLPPARAWTDESGQFHTDAVLLDYRAGKAVLQKSNDDKIVEVPLVRLCSADRSYVEQWDRLATVAVPQNRRMQIAPGEPGEVRLRTSTPRFGPYALVHLGYHKQGRPETAASVVFQLYQRRTMPGGSQTDVLEATCVHHVELAGDQGDVEVHFKTPADLADRLSEGSKTLRIYLTPRQPLAADATPVWSAVAGSPLYMLPPEHTPPAGDVLSNVLSLPVNY